VTLIALPITSLPKQKRHRWVGAGSARTLRVAKARARCLRLNKRVGAVKIQKEVRWRVLWRKP